MSEPLTVRQLRRRWKPAKDRLAAEQDNHPTAIRFHRACSWLQRVESMGDDEDHDLRLTCQWIAFNALYGQWDAAKSEPRPDRECWRAFLDRIRSLDADNALPAMLTTHKKLVHAILDDAYLAGFFWKEPSKQRATQTTRDRRHAERWYLAEEWGTILDHVMDRIYFLRCQLIHGAATHNSKLNRKSLKRCTTMLDHVLQAVLIVWIDHGSDQDWGLMCYPPVG